MVVLQFANAKPGCSEAQFMCGGVLGLVGIHRYRGQLSGRVQKEGSSTWKFLTTVLGPPVGLIFKGKPKGNQQV